MKKFLLKITLFFFPFFVYFVLIPIMAVAIRSSRISLELPKEKTILFVGDSHIEKGVNEKFIPGAFNWAKSADNPLNEFVRTRKLLKANPQIHTVFITATPHDLGYNSDARFFGGDAGTLLGLNIIFYEPKDLEGCWGTVVNALKNPRPQRKCTLAAINAGTFGTLKEFGGFEDEGDSSEGLWKEIANDGKLGKERLGWINKKYYGNALSMKYLRKLVELVRTRGGRIIFLNPPIYHAEEFYDVSYFETALKENFPDVEFWNYGNFPMPEDCFMNVNHLNGKGAEVFSKELARRMKEEGLASPSSI